MKKHFLILIILPILLISGFLIFRNKKISPKKSDQSPPTSSLEIPPEVPKINYEEIFGSEINVCKLFPQEKIEELLGKTFVEVKSGVNKTSLYTEYYCEYYQEEAKFKYEGNRPIVPKRLPITILKSNNIKEMREAYKLSGFQAKQDDEIPFPHQLIYDQNGKFRTLEIFLDDNTDLDIHPFQSNLTQEEALDFIKKFAFYFKDFVENKLKSPSPPSSYSSEQGEGVPLPQDEDIIRNFVSLIEEGSADKAAQMMKVKDETEMQIWGVHFSAINSFKLLKIEKANENEWTDTKHIYKVLLDVWMDPRSADAPIPYYGWENGQNTRWITLEKVGNTWKIAEIATGP
ncbi:MAG: hypothetical protein ACPLKP_01760 [Microgenomates group bacterium]